MRKTLEYIFLDIIYIIYVILYIKYVVQLVKNETWVHVSEPTFLQKSLRVGVSAYNPSTGVIRETKTQDWRLDKWLHQ